MLRLCTFASTALCLHLLASAPLLAQNTPENQGPSDNDRPVAADRIKTPILWEQPTNIAAEDLYLGLGGEKHEPRPPFTFTGEAKGGTNPKFDVRDADDHKWRVKLGVEARPEVTASRLLWAVGYFTDEDYNLASATVPGLRLKRGSNLVHGDQIADARFARKPAGQKKIGIWLWKKNPFQDTREFNGLRVLMAVINNWDLKDVNNAVYQDDKGNRQLFLVSDIGATFGSNSEHRTHDTDKGNLKEFAGSRFITKKTDHDVTFGTPGFPARLLFVEGPVLMPEAFRRSGIDWIGHDIPLADARWMGSLLGQLSEKQLDDAFRAGNFPADQRAGFVKIVADRIAQLKAL